MELASSFVGLAVAPREAAADVAAIGKRAWNQEQKQGGARGMVSPRERLGSGDDGARSGGAGPGRVRRYPQGVLLACKHRQRQGSLPGSTPPRESPSPLGGTRTGSSPHLISLHTATKRHHSSQARQKRRVAASTSAGATQATTADPPHRASTAIADPPEVLFPAVPNWNDDILPYGVGRVQWDQLGPTHRQDSRGDRASAPAPGAPGAWGTRGGGPRPETSSPHPDLASHSLVGLHPSRGSPAVDPLSSHARLAPAGLSHLTAPDFWAAAGLAAPSGAASPSGNSSSGTGASPERSTLRPEATSQSDDGSGVPPVGPRVPERAPAKVPRPFRGPSPFLGEARKEGRVEEVQRPEWEAMPPLPHQSLQERAALKEKAEEAARLKKRARRRRAAGAGPEAEQDLMARERAPGGLQPEAGAGAGAGGRDEARAGTAAVVATPSKEEAHRQTVRAHPAIFPISPSALRAVVPISGSGTRVLQCLGGPPDWLRRFVLSMASAVLLYNVSPICTIVAAFYWAWAPIWAAALGNMALRSKYAHAGIWVGRVRKVEPARGADGRRKWEIYVGDKSGVLIKMLADPPNLLSPLTPGEPVQMVVLSDGQTFARFRVLREAFLPRRGLWLSEEAALERPLYESLQAHIVPAVLNKLDSADDEDWDGLFSLLCDETNETLRQYSYDDTGPYSSDSEHAPMGFFEGSSAGLDAGCAIPDLGADIAIHALLSEGQEDMREQYRDYN